MKSSVVRFAPIFVFKGIDPKVITEKYFKGRYNFVALPPSRIKLHEIFHVTTPSYGTSPEEPRYQFKDKNNASVVVVTSNSKTYDIYKRAKHFEEKERRCPWCMRDYTNEPYPAAHRVKIQTHEDTTYYIFWATVFCCASHCSFSWSDREAGVSHLYESAKELQKTMFHLMYPGKKMVKAPAWGLLDLNEGPLTEEEFDKLAYVYDPTSNMVLLPAKEEYIQNQLERP
uniref:A1L transcription factor/late transcription factor VLTF-2 n=1 Tax=Pithovirus LCPAC304 TaxID=2506594 RepID=A0A481Z7M0_9VIRU|nr:MAG: A1L transcription factor/late transcription factor VLTF-2 [Pithovirus LCPAC304]